MSYCGSVVDILTFSVKEFYKHCSIKYFTCFKYCEAKICIDFLMIYLETNLGTSAAKVKWKYYCWGVLHFVCKKIWQTNCCYLLC